ncbi:MAG: hypothetical protein K0R59_3021 [Sphingobacterium sp.]|jgi:hypothetical protein|nr:hypothetical protein [Sphingobacterium sp.]
MPLVTPPCKICHFEIWFKPIIGEMVYLRYV